MWILGLIGMGVAAVLSARNPPISTTESTESVASGIIWLSSWVGFGLVGALLVSTRPSNRIGWILCGITFSLGLVASAGGYGRYALVTEPGIYPLGRPAAWLTTWTFVVPVTLAVVLVLHYPTGSATTTLGRLLTRTFLILAAFDALAFALRPGPVEGDTPPNNPIGVPGAERFLNPIISSLGIVLALLALVAVFDLFARFRRSGGIERQQFRWFLTTVGTFPILFLIANLVEGRFFSVDGFDPTVVVFPLWGNGTAAAIAIAVTRHGLYEIDRIISRTVSYGLVTAVLVGVYLGAVVVLRNLLPLQGQAAVAASTLLVAALFSPLRGRVQNAVDRRFNRSRFDAQLTMEALTRRLSSQVDLSELGRELQQVAHQTMQPEIVSVWVREARR